MPVRIQPVNDDFVAEVEDVDLAAPLDAASLTTIRQAFRDYAVLVFPGQQLDEAQQLEFARHFGPIEHNLLSYNANAKFRVDPELIDISNLTYNGEIWNADSRLRGLYVGNQLWHTDSSFKFVPARASLLYARAIPPVGGNTEFADMRAAWDALPEELRKAIDGRVAEHAFEMLAWRQLGIDLGAELEVAHSVLGQGYRRKHDWLLPWVEPGLVLFDDGVCESVVSGGPGLVVYLARGRERFVAA